MKPLFCLFALLPLAAYADDWTHHWTVSAKPELRISAGDAAVIVESGPANSIDAHLTTTGWTIGSSGVRINETQTGNKVEIEVHVPSVHISFGMRNIRLEVRVPHELLGDFHTGDGSITLRDLAGMLRVDTGDGSIHGEGLDGAIDARTGDGSIHVSGRFDKLQLHTQDGSVDVTAKEGSHIQGDWRIQTGDGSVTIRVPSNLAADLDAHTGDGAIRLDVPPAARSSKSEHSAQAKLNGGGPALVLKTGDGSINVHSL